MATYLQIDGTKISGCYCSYAKQNKSDVEVPDSFDHSGSDLREYDSALKLRPLANRVTDGLITIGQAEKVVGENIVPKTQAELVRDGLATRSKGTIVDKDSEGNATIRSATLTEQVTLGDITQATADTIEAVNVRAERDALMAGCDWTQATDCALSDALKAKWKTYRQALRDVPEQGGFPWTIEWPTSPDGVTV